MNLERKLLPVMLLQITTNFSELKFSDFIEVKFNDNFSLLKKYNWKHVNNFHNSKNSRFVRTKSI